MATRILRATAAAAAPLFKIALLSLPLHLVAQQVPDAGSILREQNQQTPQAPAVSPPPPQSSVIDETALPQAVDEGPTLLVEGFRFNGNTLVSSAVLAEQTSELVGEELSFAQLQTLGLLLTGYYAAEGYLARFTLPAQEVVDGIVEYQVLEGIRGTVQLDSGDTNLSTDRVRAFIDARLSEGQPLNLNQLGEAMNILNEQPGVNLTTSLEPGEEDRMINLNLIAGEAPSSYIGFSANNYSTRATGEAQVSLNVGAANLTGRFDYLGATLTKSEGTTSAGLNYSWAVGDRGARIGINGSTLRYELVQADFDALEAEGTANTLGLNYSYPLARRTDYGADVSAILEHSKLRDETISGETGNRNVQSLAVSWASYILLPEGWYQGILNTSATLTYGDAEQDNAAALATDQAFRDTNENFGKLEFSASHLRPIGELWSISSSLRGQIADKNLDSSARMSLGGPSGVRAFPVSEATGDEAVIANIHVVRAIGTSAGLGFFADWGRVKMNQSGALAGATTPNIYNLSGAGISYSRQIGASASFGIIAATPLTNNPAANLDGANADGRENGPRLWLNFGASF